MGYYIANDIRFLTGMHDGSVTPDSGRHMKMSAALTFIKDHPKYSYYKVRSTSKGNDYVLSTPMKFVGRDLSIVSDIKKARPFSSVEAAYKYLDTNRESIDDDITLVVDERFRRQKRIATPVVEPQIFNENEQALKDFDNATMNTSDRINIPQNIRKEIYNRSGGKCCICGKQLSKYTYTIDHIMPLSRGGTSVTSNLQAVHQNCNKFKGNFTDGEMKNMVNNIACNYICNNPNSITLTMMLRSVVRGVIYSNNKI